MRRCSGAEVPEWSGVECRCAWSDGGSARVVGCRDVGHGGEGGGMGGVEVGVGVGVG